MTTEAPKVVYVVMKSGEDQDGYYYDTVDSIYPDRFSADIRVSDIMQEARHAVEDDGRPPLERILGVRVENHIIRNPIKLPF